MAAFASGEADVLVATTVIEVGIDVPNATVMLVEDAERYGISQLHQLRGRIGRGEHASLLPAVRARPGSRAAAGAGRARRRLRLAEIDLELRSEGELVGTRQSGLRQFAVAQLPEDAELLERARACAERCSTHDPELRGARARAARRGARASASAPRRSSRSRPSRPARLPAGVRGPVAACLGTSCLARYGRRMRVIAGELGGRRLQAPRDGPRGRRPTACARRCSAMLGELDGARVLDLFAGSGALGIEALSRGAAEAVFVERDRGRVARAAAPTSTRSGSRRRGRRSAATDALARARERTRARRDIRSGLPRPPLPPGDATGGPSSRRRCRRCSRPAARVVVESDRRAPLELELALERERRYGDTSIRIHLHR